MGRKIKHSDSELARIINESGQTVDSFASAIGVNVHSLYKIVAGKRKVTYRIAERINRYTGISINNLMGNEKKEFDVIIETRGTVYPKKNGYDLRIKGKKIDKSMIDKDTDKYIRGLL